MKYYFKQGLNSRIIYPGDFFIGLDNLNHTYYDIATMNKIDREKIGVYELDEEFKYYNDTRVREASTASQVDDLRDRRILTRFKFRNNYYNCGVRDIAMANTLLALSNKLPANNVPEEGNLNWYSNDIPFFMVTSEGNIRNMDLITFTDFVKNMTLHVLSTNLAAEVLKYRLNSGEEVDIQATENWPTGDTVADYLTFSRRLIDYTYGSPEKIDENYQKQIANIASMLE